MSPSEFTKITVNVIRVFYILIHENLTKKQELFTRYGSKTKIMCEIYIGL